MQRFNVYHSRRSVWENHVVTSCGKENFFHSAVQSVLRLSLQVSLFIKQMKSISVMKKKKNEEELTKAAGNKRRLSWMAAFSQCARKILARNHKVHQMFTTKEKKQEL